MKKFSLFFICMISFAILSCTEDHDCEEGVIQTPNAIAAIDGAEYTASLLECRLPKVQTFTIQGFEGGQIVGSQGGAISIPPQSLFDENGAIIDGNVEVRLLEMFTAGEVIACQLSTNTRNATNSIEPTLSEGLLYFDILFNNTAVVINGEIQVFIPEDNNTGERFLFNSPLCPNLGCLVSWEITPIVQAFPSEILDQNGMIISGYSSFTLQAGWHNIGQFNQNANERTIVYNLPPTGFNTTNSNVFLKYDSDKIAVALFEEYDENLGVFSEIYSEIPTQTEGQLIFISKLDNSFLLDNSPVTVSQDIIGATLNVQNISEAQVITTINSL